MANSPGPVTRTWSGGELAVFVWMTVGSVVSIQTYHASSSTAINQTSLPSSANSASASVETIIPDSLKFQILKDCWHRERGVNSSITQIAMCSSYQRIIAMGPRVIPIILRQMSCEADHPDLWFWALRALTNENPVAKQMRGNFRQMARAWLEWGRNAGYV